MSYQQTFRPDLNLVITRFERILPLDVFRQCAIDTFRDPAYRAGMGELYDFRAVTEPDPQLSYHTIQEVWHTQSTWIRELRQNATVMMVASSDLMYGLVRIYSSLAAQGNLRVIASRDWNLACRTMRLPADVVLAEQAAEG